MPMLPLRAPSAFALVVTATIVATLAAGVAPSALALDAPGGVIGILAGERENVPCGGAAVVIAVDGPVARALTLAEALPSDPAGSISASLNVVFPGGARRAATVERRGAGSTAVLLRIVDPPPGTVPVALADGRRVAVGDTAWTAGNSYGSLELDGQVALSRGVVSGSYDIPADAPPVRGRGGRILSAYRGPLFECDAAINDGNQGGALLDAAGRLIGLVSLGAARERRLGSAIPLHLILADLGLAGSGSDGGPPLADPAGTPADGAALISAARSAGQSVALVYFERTGGLGNPPATPRPPKTVDEVPAYERPRMQQWWDAYYHMQQFFFTDQPVSALVVSATELVTAASNLHGGATRGRVLVPGRSPIACAVVARHLPLDLVLLACDETLPLPATSFSEAPAEVGEPVAVTGRHRADGGATITTGVVSAARRRRERSAHQFAQTDAIANYGSLGGAVVDASGRILGMPVMMAPDTDWPWFINSGVALFVEGGTIAAALPGLRAGRSVESAPPIGLGVQMAPTRDARCLVESVLAGTGAEAAGLRKGDVIVQVDRLAVSSRHAIARAIARRRIGDVVAVVIERDGARRTLEVEVKELP